MNKNDKVTCDVQRFINCCGMNIMSSVRSSPMYGTPFSTLILNLTMPTVLVSNVNDTDERYGPQYIQAAIEVCEENDMRYIVAPSWINDVHPYTSCSAIIIFPKRTRLDATAHSWRTVDPGCENRTYATV